MNDIVNKLESAGFTNYESKVICVLFKGQQMTVSEIAKEADIPRTSAYDILKLFTQKGICNEIQTSSAALYEIIDPQVVEAKIEKQMLDSYKVKADKLKDSFAELRPIYKTGSDEGHKNDVELIRGYNKHRDMKFMELWKESSKELLLMNRLEGHIDSTVDEFTAAFLKNGGTIKTLYEVSYNFRIFIDGIEQVVTRESFIDIAGSLEGESGEVKLTEKLFQNMAIFDRKAVYVSIVDPAVPKYNRSDIIVRNENYASAMADYFETCWKRSFTIEEFKRKLINS